jgi:hypothetical protein
VSIVVLCCWGVESVSGWVVGGWVLIMCMYANFVSGRIECMYVGVKCV